MADNISTLVNGISVTFTTDLWGGDPNGASQILPSKMMWGTRDTTYKFVDDITGQRMPVKVGEALPAGGNVIGGVTQSGTWTVGISGAVSLPTNAAQETGGNLAAIAAIISAGAAAVTVATLPLPSNAAKESGGNLAILATNLPAKGAAVTAASMPVNIASDQVVPISATALPLPTGAAKEAGGNLDTLALRAALTAPQVIPATGLYYLGFMCAESAGGVPTLCNSNAGTANLNGGIAGMTPILAAVSTTGLAGVAPSPAGALTAITPALYAFVD